MPTPKGLVTFVNVKPKYYLNDDILLEYVLMDSKFQPCYRDFIGLYPRGWNDELQYVAYEWIIPNSLEISPRRNIFFKCRYHSRFVHTDREYQFVYMNHNVEVMARSRYFKFVPANPMANLEKTMHKKSSYKVLTPSISLHAGPILQVRSKMSASAAGMLGANQKSVCPMQSKDEMHLITCNSQIASSSNYIPDLFNLDSQNMNFATCVSETHENEVDGTLLKQQNVDSQEKSSGAWIHNLEDRNKTLVERIEDLENELQISLLTQKRLILEAHHSKMEKLAYQKFIHGLVNALSQKGIARIIDDQGRDMDLVVVPKEVVEACGNADSMKPSEQPVAEVAAKVQKGEGDNIAEAGQELNESTKKPTNTITGNMENISSLSSINGKENFNNGQDVIINGLSNVLELNLSF